MRFPRISRLIGLAQVPAALLLVVGLAGCEGMSPRNFDPNSRFIDPSELAVTTSNRGPLLVPILDKLNTGIDEPAAEFTNATDTEINSL